MKKWRVIQDKKESLLELGFKKVDAYEYFWGDTFDDKEGDDYVREIGRGRRGQNYYLIINKDIEIYATKPDGSGCPTDASTLIELLLTMKEKGIIEQIKDKEETKEI